MELIGVRVEMRTNQPIVLLRETVDGGRILPIFIGGAEATAISLALEGVQPPRPMTHDLFVDVIESVGGGVERVLVTELRDKTFYAELEIRTESGVKTVSARPSDSIALAVRTGAAIFATEEVLTEAAYVDDPDSDDGEQEEVVEQFRAFLDDINPEDFGS